MKRDPRPPEYKYWNQLNNHLGDDINAIKRGDFAWPRQWEIHLPGDHVIPCDLDCPHCAGRLFDKSLGIWEMDALELMDKVAGKIPYHIYGGAYTEPTINPYFMTFLAMTKKHGNHFGIHTNGVNLIGLQRTTGFLTELNRISTDRTDYLSVSIDAGTEESWCKTKGVDFDDYIYADDTMFHDIFDGISTAAQIRKNVGGGEGHAIRLCYLISPASDSDRDFASIVNVAKEIGVDSIRFSIPFANYNQSFESVKKYKQNREIPGDKDYSDRLSSYLSKSEDEHPYIFYTGPEFTDIDKYTFNDCYYGYYQITFGADGYCYKCSTTATPTAKQCRLGKIPRDLGSFMRMIRANEKRGWDCKKNCFVNGLRCNRMGLEINLMAIGKDIIQE